MDYKRVVPAIIAKGCHERRTAAWTHDFKFIQAGEETLIVRAIYVTGEAMLHVPTGTPIVQCSIHLEKVRQVEDMEYVLTAVAASATNGRGIELYRALSRGDVCT